MICKRKIKSNHKVFWFGRMKFPVINTGKTVMAVHWSKYFGYVKFGMPITNPNEDVK